MTGTIVLFVSAGARAGGVPWQVTLPAVGCGRPPGHLCVPVMSTKAPVTCADLVDGARFAFLNA
ncbi:hypothetical protein ACFYPN_07815 [Streptomyces sp. NPDC005576]|uniref:hypothetical protein n=1 Tax=Streptomyces sp. NPDC005576 TaxID=3364726 RepID=UPI003677A979